MLSTLRHFDRSHHLRRNPPWGFKATLQGKIKVDTEHTVRHMCFYGPVGVSIDSTIKARAMLLWNFSERTERKLVGTF